MGHGADIVIVLVWPVVFLAQDALVFRHCLRRVGKLLEKGGQTWTLLEKGLQT